MEKTPLPLQKSDVKILVVDDRADNLLSIEVILEKDNYTLITAAPCYRIGLVYSLCMDVISHRQWF